jgi:DNA primase
MPKKLAARPVNTTRTPLVSKNSKEFKRALNNFDRDAPPAPRNALRVLFRAASRDDHAGRAARYFLFWLDGEVPPDGPSEDDGASQLLNLLEKQQQAAFEVLQWWLKPGKNMEPILTLQEKIRAQFAAKNSSPRSRK